MGSTWELRHNERQHIVEFEERQQRHVLPSSLQAQALGDWGYPLSTHDHSHEQQPMSVRTLSPHAILSQHHLGALLAYGRCFKKVGTIGYTT